MEWRDLRLSDKATVEALYESSRCRLSDLTFTNLFMWVDSRKTQICHFEDFLFFEVLDQKYGPTLYNPLGNGKLKNAIKLLLKDAENRGHLLRFKAVSEEFVKELKSQFPNHFAITSSGRDDDYLYRYDDLVNLSGKAYQKKRNHIHHFQNEYMSKYRSINKEDIPDLMEFVESWLAKQPKDAGGYIEDEGRAALRALEHFESLNLRGAMLFYEERIIAFTLGELVHSDTVIIHVEKADTEYLGSYQMINQAFLEKEWKGKRVEFVNRESDLGVAGLRQAKQSYHPAEMIKKYDAVYLN
ncbi:Uncharacterized protein SCG7109_BH_00080 [Chlamydiales bacterium SCGC AG-110-M15]|nr:Uncharacterized protein SCG7109_BH_00080 [Chlamydiales bacterium SCGC AG-110-M15]